MAEVNRLQQFKQVESDVKIGQRLVQLFEFSVVHIFKDQGRSSGNLKGTSKLVKLMMNRVTGMRLT